VDDGSTSEEHTREVLTPEAAARPGTLNLRSQLRQRRAGRWSRNGTASPFGTRPEDGGGGVGWSWQIRREGSEERRIAVEVSPGPYRVTDLPAEARNAIRSRGATAVDAFLETDDPPVRIVVSTQGLQPHHADPPLAIDPSEE
jgi:hypothetical protein